MREFLITPLEMLTEAPEGITPNTILIYSYIYYLCCNNIDRYTNIKNNELAAKLRFDINTVKSSVKSLKAQGYITIHGSTRNRKIQCNTPEDVIKEIKLKKQEEQAREAEIAAQTLESNEQLSKYQLDKWYLEYMEDVSYKQRLDDVKGFLCDQFQNLSVIERYYFEKSADPKEFKNFPMENFVEYIHSNIQTLKEKERISRRAKAYDLQHESSVFRSEFRKYNQDAVILYDRHPDSYHNLSECPFETQKTFLNWLEPELF